MTEDDICVSVRGVSKKFSRSLKRSFAYGARDIGRMLLGRKNNDYLRASEFWALHDVSFELPRGRSIGIVGLNGSGKTTLLRMISGILRPTLGSIEVNGRVAPMLALGAGFKPVLSGRENIFLNLTLLGVSARDIRARYDSIIDFAELHDAIDAPIGTYSSGMLGRLGFACAVHTDPEILIVDEVLSVGDARFRVKCRNRINELRKAGTSFLLVSHSALLVESLSDECIYLSKGRVITQGPSTEVLKIYQKDIAGNSTAIRTTNAGAILETSKHKRDVAIRSVVIRSPNIEETGFWFCSSPGELVISLESAQELEGVTVNLMLFDQTYNIGENVQILRSWQDDGLLRLQRGQSTITLHLPQVGLRPGMYRLKIAISQRTIKLTHDVVDNLQLTVRDRGNNNHCLYYQPRSWSYTGAVAYQIEERRLEDDEIGFID